MSKTANNTHRRAMRTVTPASRAGRVGAGAALATAMLFGGAAAATADPQADAPQADAAPALLSAAVAPAVGIPAIEVAAVEAEPALAPAAGTISIEVGPTEEEIAAAEAAEREAAELEAAEQAEQTEPTQQDASAGESTETRGDNSASRSEERSSRDGGSGQDDSSSSESRSSESRSSESRSSGSSSSESSTKQEPKKKAAPAPSAGKGSSILATARSGIGTPYVYGGTSTSGWDCSGFVQWVYGQHGISLPRGAGDQAAAGTVISRSEARPGDLVYKPGHIGIYAGGNQFVDAGNTRVDTSERNIYSGSWTFIRVG